MNIGFLEASKLFPAMNCVMFQDADSLLEDDRLLMRCDDRPHHYALTLNRWQYKSDTTLSVHYTACTRLLQGPGSKLETKKGRGPGHSSGGRASGRSYDS